MPDTQLTREQKASRFRAIVDRRARMSQDWQLTPEGDGIVARLIAAHPIEPVLTFDVNADRNDIAFVAAAPDDIDFLIERVRDLGRQLLDLQPKPRREMTTANRAGRLLGDYDFQRWIFETDGFEKVSDKQALKTHIRLKLSIESLNDLDTDDVARTRYFKLVNDFEAWNKRRTRR